jgi:LytR cell envelope-related transcriptional attenuator
MTALAHAPALGARVLRTVARGAVLVGVAIVLGIVLLQVVHDSGTPSAGGGTKVSGSTTTSTSGTTAATGATKSASVTVLNGSGVTGAATTRANALRGLGYAIKATTNAASTQAGTTVVCKTGDQTVADAIAKSIGPTTTATTSATMPATAGGADCLVTVGK